jgi:MarR family transcriptional regulator, organic hydroperoxide resistance regulator
VEETGPASEQLDYALADAVLRVNEALQRTVAALMSEFQLTEPLANAIWQLGPGERPLSRRELAGRLHCDPSNVTFLVDRLEEKGLVTRAADPRDRRVKAVSLTAAGATVRKRLVAAATAAPVFVALTEEQKQQLTRLLQLCLAAEAGAEASAAD